MPQRLLRAKITELPNGASDYNDGNPMRSHSASPSVQAGRWRQSSSQRGFAALLTAVVACGCVALPGAVLGQQASGSGRTRNDASSKRAASEAGPVPQTPDARSLGAITAAQHTSAALARRLSTRLSLNWGDVPLTSALADLSAHGKFPLLVDRRIDPDRPLSLSVRDQSIDDILRQIAAAEGLGVSRFGPLVYVGPPSATTRLRTLAVIRAQEIAELPPAARQRWTAATRWSWPRFSTPRELLAQLAQEAGLELQGLDRVPHDLWPAVELPPLTVADRLTLLANEFDLTFRIEPSGTQAEMTPIDAAPVVVRSYPAGPDPERTVHRWTALAPAAEITTSGGQLLVRARVEDHELLRQPASAASSATPSLSTASGRASTPPSGQPDPDRVRVSRLELKELPLRTVIPGLARQLGLRVEMDDAAIEKAGVSLDQAVSIDLSDATIDDVWRAALEPAGLKFKRSGRVIAITPAAP